jgi:TonB-linked SusC/RagA family outer membrane protein
MIKSNFLKKVNEWKRIAYLCAILLSLCSTIAFAQGTTITGTVTDESGEALIGVSVFVRGTPTIGASTNVNGVFSLSQVPPQSTLVFTYLGYVAQEVAVGNQTTINVQMREDTQMLDEVVVIGFGTQRRASITSSIVNIGSEELLRSPTVSLGNALAGRLPGLAAIQYSGLPGWDDPTILVRGVGTLSQNQSSPLILVDGVERPFTQLDPNEVADISILKDAGATAVFGVRGANGVILVTTKRGEVGRARISTSASFGVHVPLHLVSFADSYTYATTFNNAQINDGVNPALVKYGEYALERWKLMDQPLLYPSTDWMTYIMNDYSLQNQFNVNVSGGNETTRYFISVGKLFQDGLLKTFEGDDPRSKFKYNRYNYRANLDIDVTKSTTLSLTLGGRLEDRNSTGDPNQEDNREGNIYRYIMEAAPMSGAGIVDGKLVVGNMTYVGTYRNNRHGLSEHYGRGYRNEVTSVLNLDLALAQKLDMVTQGLLWKFKGSYNNTYAVEKIRRAADGSGGNRLSTYMPWPETDGDGNIVGVVLAKQSERQNLGYQEEFSFGRNWYFETSFDYRRRFGYHNLSALLLYNQTKRFYPSQNTEIPNGYIGVVSRITYDYSNKYLFDVNMGINGSENFAPGKRYGYFPSGSVGWLLTEEEFMKEQNIINYLKLRYSFGIVGSDRGTNNNRFLYMPAAYYHGNPRNIGSNDLTGYGFGTVRNVWQLTVREATMGNPDVTWEKARKQNIGLDFSVLNQRLRINTDYFWEHRWDILINNSAVIPAYMAFPSLPQVNFGKVNNWGYELSLNWSDRIGRDISYTIAPNMSFNRNKIIEQQEIPRNYDYQYRTGHKVGQHFGYEFFEFYEPGETEKRYEAKYGKKFPNHITTLKPGYMTYVDLNNDGVIDNEDQWAIGYPDYPEFTFGLNINLRYKRFDISMLWIGNANTNRQLGGPFSEPFGTQNDSALLQWVADNYWTPDNPNPKLPTISLADRAFNSRFSSVYLADASYARLKNLEIGYNVDVRGALSFINSARIYLTGQNLLTFTNYRSNDPETSGGQYGEFFRYPPTRIYNIGLRVNF